MSDVTIWLDPTGGFGKVKQISPNDLRMLEYKIIGKFDGMLYKLGMEILKELIWGWQQKVKARPRTEGQHLSQLLQRALSYQVSRTKDELWVGIFDLLSIDKATRNQGKHTSQEGWFMLFEDGHEDFDHGSSQWQFIGIDFAMTLAEECAEEMDLKPDERAEFLVDVRDVFSGRHGEGIMVNLNKPLFFRYPAFRAPHGKGEGTARDILGNKTHSGFRAWNVIKRTQERFQRGDKSSFVDALIMEAAAEAAKEI